MPLRVESAGRTHPGLMRERNEDALHVGPELGLWVVCDGMGGHLGGQVASQSAVDAIVEAFRDAPPGSEAPDALVSAIRSANRAVFQRARADAALYNMGTTVVAARRVGDRLHLCHVGDSRIYRWRRGELEQVTRDHSLTNLYVDNPELEARFGPANPNVIVRAVGLRETVEVDHLAVDLERDDMYLLCCDGLTDMVDDWIIKEILADGWEAPLDECADALVRAALGNGGIDNTTVIILRISQA